MKINQQLSIIIDQVLKTLYPEAEINFVLEHPADLTHGDYALTVAMKLAKQLGRNPREIAEEIIASLSHHKELHSIVDKMEVAGPGFINLTILPEVFSTNLQTIDENFGKNTLLEKKKAIVEYTDPNPFKVLHIGHLMNNTLGESFSRIIEWSGAEIKRACYQGDVGMHVAKSLWGIIAMGVENIPKEKSLSEQVVYLGQAYAKGSTAYSEGEENVSEAIKKINKQVYEQSDETLNDLYAWGRLVSLDYFELQYKILGTKFDYYFFESKVASTGMALVDEYLQKGIFEESKGAIIFPGEKYDLHTRVFKNAEGLPTYEAKELGLAKIKYETYPYDLSVVVTGNEINQYFQVLLKAMSFIYPELQEKTKHIGHGMLRLPSGKMSSRTGSIIAAEDLINQVQEQVLARDTVSDSEVAMKISIAAIKFSILSQSAGSDIIFDFEKSLSFEGDTGPYLQYTYARSKSVLRKAESLGLQAIAELPADWQTTEVEKIVLRLPEEVEKSLKNYSSHYIANYLLLLAHTYNSWYGNTKIIEEGNPQTSYKLALTKAVAQTIKNGLWLLGIEIVEEM